MKRIVFGLLLLASFLYVVPAYALAITSGQYIGSGGVGTGESLAGDRFRSFLPGTGSENYLGIPNLGTAGNRVERNINWMTDPNNPLTSFDFIFQYDAATDQLVSTISGSTIPTGTIYWNNWSTGLASRGKTKDEDDLNAFQISITLRDANSSVYLTDMVLDGTALGSFNGVMSTTQNWLVTGSDMNLTDGFTMTGTLWLQGPFLNGGQENSAVNLSAGWDSRGFAPAAPVPEPATTGLMGFGLLGMAATRIRKRKIA